MERRPRIVPDAHLTEADPDPSLEELIRRARAHNAPGSGGPADAAPPRRGGAVLVAGVLLLVVVLAVGIGMIRTLHAQQEHGILGQVVGGGWHSPTDAITTESARGEPAGGAGDASMAEAGDSAPRGWCTVGDRRYALTWDGRQRLWMTGELLPALKARGGTCEVDLGRPTTFVYNSVEGRVTVDGHPLANGNGLLATGRVFVATYDGTASDGFDLRPRES